MSEQPNNPAPDEPGEKAAVDVGESAFAQHVLKTISHDPEPPEMIPPAPPPQDPPAEPPKPPVEPAPTAKPEEKPTDSAEPPAPTDNRESNLAALRGLKEQAEADLRKARQETEELRQQLSGYDPSQLSKLQRDLEQSEKAIKRLSVEGDPRFKAEYDEKVQQAIDDATALAGDSAELVAEALRMPEGRAKQQFLNNLLEDADERAREEIKDAARDIRRLNNERSRHLKDWEKTHADMIKADEEIARQEEQKRQAQAQVRTREAKELFDRVIKASQDPERGLPHMVPKEGDQAHNDRITAMTEAARHQLFGGEEVSLAESFINVLKGVNADALMNENRLLLEQNRRLEGQVKELTAASPEPSAAQPAGDPSLKLGFMDKLRQQMGGKLDPE